MPNYMNFKKILIIHISYNDIIVLMILSFICIGTLYLSYVGKKCHQNYKNCIT